MADALNLKIIVDNTVPQAMAQAAAAVEDSTSQIRSSFTKVQTVIKDSEDKIRYSMTEARHAIRGVGEEVGIHMPRFVSTFLAELPAVGAAMSAAFSTVAIIGIVEMVATTLPKAFAALQEKITGWGEAARQAYDKLIESNKQAEEALLHFQMRMNEALGKGFAANVDLVDVKLKSLQGEAKGLRETIATIEAAQARHEGGGTRATGGISLDEYKAMLEKVNAEMKHFADMRVNMERDADIEITRLAGEAFDHIADAAVKRGEREAKAAAQRAAQEATWINESWTAHVRFDEQVRTADTKLAEDQKRLAEERAKAYSLELSTLVESYNRQNTEIAKILEEGNRYVLNSARQRLKYFDEVTAGQMAAADRQLKAEETAIAERVRISGEGATQAALESEAALERWYDVHSRILNQALENAKAAYGEESAEYQKLINKKKALDDEYASHQHAVQIKLIESNRQAIDNITSKVNTGVMEWIEGQEKFGMAMAHAWNSLASTAIMNLIKVAEARLIARRTEEADKVKDKLSDASESARKAFKSVMGALPFPANVIVAPVVAAGAAAAIMAFQHGGIMPETNMALLHRNEMVLPADLAAGLQAIIRGGSPTTNIGGGTVALTNNFNGNVTRDDADEISKKVLSSIRRLVRRGDIQIP